jgi:pimeloyl-ACP methyl ester carboxylesterase
MVDRRLARNAEGGAGRASIQDGDRQRGDASEASRGRCCERIGGPPQNFKEYDPEWARAFTAGTAMSGCDHVRMLESVRVPVLFTHHFRQLEAGTGALMGAISDVQVQRVRDLVTAAGQTFDYFSFPEMAHQMHEQDPELFARLIDEWATKLT